MAFAEDLRRALEQLRTSANRDLDNVFLPTAPQIEAAMAGDERAARLVADALHDVLPGLLDTYRLSAASIAADLYELERDAAGIAGAYAVDVPDLGDGGAHALAGWSMDEATSSEALKTLVFGGFDRRMTNAANQVIQANTYADPGADGWQRHARATGCRFCRMLAGRGDVYTATTADFAPHDHCHCVAAIAWNGQERPVRLDAEGKRLDSSTRTSRMDAEQRRTDNERIRDWIESHGLA